MHEQLLPLAISGMEVPFAFTTPDSAATAAVLLIPGSLFSDVDGNYPTWNMSPHAYKDLAHHLADLGIATLRFAKVGPGTGSTIVDADAWARVPKSFEQRLLIADAFLKRLRAEFPALPVFLAGHSEGSLVATILAQSASGLAGIVLLSGPSKPLLRLMADQQFETDQRKGLATAEREVFHKEMDALLSNFVHARPLPENLTQNPYASGLVFSSKPEVATYMRSLEAIDPAAELSKVRLPVLIIQGGRDTSVFPENADRLLAVKPDAAVERFPELQHFYKAVPDGLPIEAQFGISTESDPAVAAAISRWIMACQRT
ncbi:MAG TPA: alpha/beta fold hydrolase [Bryobacteraceae bacterium]|jgi:hypothetical protein